MVRRMLRAYPLSLVAVVGVVALSLLPIPETPLEDVPFYDKWAHFVMYGGLSLAVWWETRREVRGRSVRGWLKVVGMAMVGPAVLGGLMEVAQEELTTYRSGDWMDFLADCVGVCLAAVCVGVWKAWRRWRGVTAPPT